MFCAGPRLRLGQCQVHAAGVPEHSTDEHQPEPAQLVFLAFVVSQDRPQLVAEQPASAPGFSERVDGQLIIGCVDQGRLQSSNESALSGARARAARTRSGEAPDDAERPPGWDTNPRPRRRSSVRERNEQEIASSFGFESFGDYYRDRRSRGWTLSAICEEIGRDRQWIRRARREYDSEPALHHNVRLAEWRHQQRARELGFPDLDCYLRMRHLGEGKGTAEMGRELGVDSHRVRALLQRRGILQDGDQLRREWALGDRREVGARLGFESFEAYLADRRSRGWSVARIAQEAGRNTGWVISDPGTGERRRLPPPLRSLPEARSPLPPLPGALGQLEDGTPYYAPLGVLPYDEYADRVQCHLCGHWFRSVGRHAWLAHGWRHREYVNAFGLRTGRPLCTASSSETIRVAMRMLYRRSLRMRSYLAKGQAMLKDRVLRRQWSAKRRRRRLVAQLGPRRRELVSLFWGSRQEDVNRRIRARLHQLGFADLESYLRDRYLGRGRTMRKIAAEGVGSNALIRMRLLAFGIRLPGGGRRSQRHGGGA